MEYLRQLSALVRKDLALELRTRERIAAMGAFVVLVAILFNYAIDRTAVSMQEISAGLIWMTVVFGGMLGLGRTFQMEEEDGAFQGILLAPIPRDAVYLGKVMANFILLMVVVALVFVVFGIFFDLRFGSEPLVLTTVMLLGVLGFVAIGTLFSAISHRTTMGETLLPILVFPLLVPVVIFGVTATARLFVGRPVAEVSGNVRMLAAYANVGLVSGVVLLRYEVED